MKFSVKHVLWLMAALPLIQGCSHKTQTAQVQPLAPPVVDAPLPKPQTVSPADLPPPVISAPPPAKPQEDTTPPPPEPKKKPVRHPKKPATTPAPTPAPVETASIVPPNSLSVPATGVLSGGASGDVKNATEDSISNIEKGLNGIGRSLNDSEQKTAAQIREFLKQAREALATGDADGAHLLAEKAKVLLNELNGK